MKRRHLTQRVLSALSDTPVVFIRGARQCGKTTLVNSLRALGHDADYLTLDDSAVLAAATRDPDGFVSGLPRRVILDEVQRAPGLFRAIKRSVDSDRRPGRFLLTGSANALVLPKVSESLAGRMEVLTLWPLSQGELSGRVEGFIDACHATGFKAPAIKGASWSDFSDRIVRGGFPEVQGRADPARRAAWFDSYQMTILERDVRDISNVQGLREMPQLLRICATRAMGLMNLADISREAAIPQTTLARYWSLFELTFLATLVPPWSTNLGKRLVKSPKLLFADTGLLCFLLGVDAAALRGNHLMSGHILESFVACELLKQLSWSKTGGALYHYRTHTQQEVDFLLEDPAGRVVGIEVKKTSSPGANDFKGLLHLKETLGKRFRRGILLHCGTTGVAFSDDLHALPVNALWDTPIR